MIISTPLKPPFPQTIIHPLFSVSLNTPKNVIFLIDSISKMYKKYFPACDINGSINPPAPFNHMGLRGAVPAKCANCSKLLEGECTRHMEIVGGYLHLDHGPCSIDGPSDPVIYENTFIQSKVTVPRKCSTCRFLSVAPIFGFQCHQDANKWGDFKRGLDWGAWKPSVIYLQLPEPKVTTKVLSQAVFDNDQIAFIREYRRVNPELSIEEAKMDFITLRKRIDNNP
ncbi:Uncharacterised protein [Leminorella richardii]|uniref:Uncharacterized protein n=2 Tax=Leminorella richardii TaxID=158841 RepID=A0A2X4UMK8_9GAMM|nr:Uncharacterised protein [Leminorella richardii]